jgi:Fe-S-cluster-containing dehydrogenase component
VRYGIAIDTARCMACYNCFMACKDEHCGHASKLSAPQPHTGQFWMNIIEWERGDRPGNIKVATVPTPCSHCQDPSCMKVAKNGAVYKRDDGIVIIDPEKSKGQKAIADACPIGAAFWNEELQIAQKCTMCAELLDEGYKMPRCVESCPNQALIFGDLDDPNSEISKKIAAGKVTPLKGLEGIETNVVHLNIPSVFLAGTVYLPDDEVAIGASVTLTCKETGSVFKTETNWAGDWEAEDLEKDKEFDIVIEMDGYKPVKLSAKTDTDHFVDETLLEPAK